MLVLTNGEIRDEGRALSLSPGFGFLVCETDKHGAHWTVLQTGQQLQSSLAGEAEGQARLEGGRRREPEFPDTGEGGWSHAPGPQLPRLEPSGGGLLRSGYTAPLIPPLPAWVG